MYLFDEPQRRRKSCSPESKREPFKAQNGKCMYCGRKPGIDLMDIDHKNSMARGARTRSGTCNTKKGATTGRQFRTKFKAAGVLTTQNPPAKPIPRSKFDEIAKKAAGTKAKKSRNARTDRQRTPPDSSNSLNTAARLRDEDQRLRLLLSRQSIWPVHPAPMGAVPFHLAPTCVSAERQPQGVEVSVRHIPQPLGYASGQLIASAQAQLLQVGEPAQLGRYLPGQLVPFQIQRP